MFYVELTGNPNGLIECFIDITIDLIDVLCTYVDQFEPVAVATPVVWRLVINWSLIEAETLSDMA